jgi:cysteine-rich repeat protein
MYSRAHLRALLAVALLTAAGCSKDAVPTTPLPTGVNIAGLLPQHQALLRVTLEIADETSGAVALKETQLKIGKGLDTVSGTFDVTDVTTRSEQQLTLRLYGRFAEDAVEVLLGRFQKPVTLEPNVDVAIDLEGAIFEPCAAGRDGRCSLLFDANRNGATNIDDLLERERSAGVGIDPAPQEPFLSTSSEQLQFPSGVRLGTFARQLVVLENFGAHPIAIDSAVVVGGQGFTISILDPGGLVSVATPSRELTPDQFQGAIQPGEEAFIAVSFAPVNAFVTTGSMFVRVTDTVTRVAQTARVKLIANPEGELRPADGDYVEPNLSSADATVGTVPVVAFPNAQLHSGDSMIAEDALGRGLARTGALLDLTIDEAVVAFPADAAFVVDVRPGERFATTIDGLVSDVDIAVVDVVDGAIAGLACATCASSNAGTSPEAVEFKNDGAGVRRVLVVLGRIEDEPVAAGIPGGLVAAETVTFRCSTTVNLGPEFDVVAPLAPTNGPLEGGIPVTLKGTGFSERARVYVGAAEALDVAVDTDADGHNTVTFTLPAAGGTENPASIIVENPIDGGDGQAATLLEAFTYQPPAPVIDELGPDRASTLGSTAPITITGRFFSARHGPPRVSFGDVAVDATFVNASTITALAPAFTGVNPGIPVNVRAHNRLAPDDGEVVALGAASNPVAFRYVEPDGAPPSLTAVSPNAGSVDGGTTVVLTGTDLRPGVEVFFNGRRAACQVPVATTTIECLTPASDAAVAVAISLVNADGQSVAVADAFAYIVPAPSVSSVFPPRGIDDGGTLVIIEGGGFRPGARVTFSQGGADRAARAVTRVSGTTLLVTTPEGASGPATVTIANLDGQEVETAFTYFAPNQATPPPTLLPLSPATGDASGGFPVVISGTGFSSPSVIFGSTNVEVTNFIDRTPPELDELTVPAPSSPTGVAAAVNVQLLNDDGQSAAAVFNYTFAAAAPPRIDRVDPATFTQGVSTSFTVFGTRFASGARVFIGGVQAPLSQVSSSTIRGTTDGRLSLGSVLLVVEHPDGTSVSVPVTVAPVRVPFITSVTPDDVHAAVAGDLVTILGDNFDVGPATVTVGAFGGSVGVSANVRLQTRNVIVVELPALTPVAHTIGVAFQTLDGRQTVVSPPIQAHRPFALFAGGEGESSDLSSVRVFGDFLNPDRLRVDVRTGSVVVPCPLVHASETSIQCQVLGPIPRGLASMQFTWTGSFGGVPQAAVVVDGAALGVDSFFVGDPFQVEGGEPVASSTDFSFVNQTFDVIVPGLDPSSLPGTLEVFLNGASSQGQITGFGVPGPDRLTVTLNAGRSANFQQGASLDARLNGRIVITGQVNVVARRFLSGENATTWPEGPTSANFNLPGDEGRIIAVRQGDPARTVSLAGTRTPDDALSVATIAPLAPGAWSVCFEDQADRCAEFGGFLFVSGVANEVFDGIPNGISANNASVSDTVEVNGADAYFFIVDRQNTALVTTQQGCADGVSFLVQGGTPNVTDDLCDGLPPTLLQPGAYEVRVTNQAQQPTTYRFLVTTGGGAQGVCGNGVVDGFEICDDGNGADGDGCSRSCLLDPGFSCTGSQPTVCVPNGGFCGNGGVDGAPAPSGQGVATEVITNLDLIGGAGAGVAVDDGGTVYVVENATGALRSRTPDGQERLLVGRGAFTTGADIEVGPDGFLYVADGGADVGSGRVFRVDPQTGTATVFIGGLNSPSGLAFDGPSVLVASFNGQSISRFAFPSGTPMGQFGNQLSIRPVDIELGWDSNLYVSGFAVSGTQTAILSLSPQGVATTFADVGLQDTSVTDPHSLAFDGDDNLWVSYYGGLKLVRYAFDGRAEVFLGGITGDDAINGLAIGRDGALFTATDGDRSTATAAIIRIDGLATGFGEACDDGNTSDGDGCSRACSIDPGASCVGAGPGSCIAAGQDFSLNSLNVSLEPIVEPSTGAQLVRGGTTALRLAQRPAVDGVAGHVSLNADGNRLLCSLGGADTAAFLCDLNTLDTLAKKTLASFTVEVARNGGPGVSYRSAANGEAYLRHRNDFIFVEADVSAPGSQFNGDASWERVP